MGKEKENEVSIVADLNDSRRWQIFINRVILKHQMKQKKINKIKTKNSNEEEKNERKQKKENKMTKLRIGIY